MILVLILFFWVSGDAAAYDKGMLVTRFAELDRSFNNGAGYSNSTNDDGLLAWGESYLLEAYLDVYEGTGDTHYLNKFIEHADRVIAQADAERRIVDYKGRSVTGWSATLYSVNQERVVHMVHTGLIGAPLARFSLIVRARNLEAYSRKAVAYKKVVIAAASIFDSNWSYSSRTGEGHYLFSPDDPTRNGTPPPMPVPFNQQLTFGRLLIYLADLTGNGLYLKRARGLARHFRNHLKDLDGTYIWNYWYDKGLEITSKPENISYAPMDLAFAVLAFEKGIVFTAEDIQKFLATYRKNVYKAGKFANLVDGSGEGQYKDAVGRWLVLADFDCSVWNDFEKLLASGTLSGHPQVMLGIAKLVRYYNRCGPK
jgi:hypothetical protein